MSKPIDKIKKLTMPMPTYDIYRELALAYAEIDGQEATEELIEGVVYDIATDALEAYVPSGEIGNNPRTPKIADSFFNEFPDVLGKSGFFSTKMVNASPKTVSLRERQFKSILVNLSQLYLEVQAKLKTKGRELEDKTYSPSSFEHNAHAKKGEPTEDEMKRMIRVETNRYIRLFMATYFTHISIDAMKTNADNIIKIINSLQLIDGPEAGSDAKAVLRHLRNGKTRSNFVKRLRDHLSEFKLKALE